MHSLRLYYLHGSPLYVWLRGNGDGSERISAVSMSMNTMRNSGEQGREQNSMSVTSMWPEEASLARQVSHQLRHTLSRHPPSMQGVGELLYRLGRTQSVLGVGPVLKQRKQERRRKKKKKNRT